MMENILFLTWGRND